jgi:hypothetical protein
MPIKINRLTLIYYERYPLSFRQVEDILSKRKSLRRDKLYLITTTPPLFLFFFNVVMNIHKIDGYSKGA